MPEGAAWIQLAEGRPGAERKLSIVSDQTARAIRQARQLRKKGESARAVELLHGALPGLNTEDQVRARAVLARIRLDTGAVSAAATALGASMDANLRAGRLSDALDDAAARAFVLTRLARYGEARDALSRATAGAAKAPASTQALLYYRGVLAREVGDVRSALRLVRRAARGARRLAMVEYERVALEQIAVLLSTLGRHEEALAAQERALSMGPPQTPCRRLKRVENLLWISLVALTEGHGHHGKRVRQILAQGDALVPQCHELREVRNHHINAGLLALHVGDEKELAYRLDALTHLEGGKDVLLSAWEEEIRGRVALARQQPRQARAHFAREVQLAEGSALWKNIYLGYLGLGQSARQLGERQVAMDAYRRADSAAADLLRSVPLGEGRTAFQVRHEGPAQALAALLIDAGDAAGALSVLRGARLRVWAASLQTYSAQALTRTDRVRWERAAARYRLLRAELEADQANSWRLSTRELKRAGARRVAQRTAVREALDDLSRAAKTWRPSGPPPLPAEPDQALLAFFRIGDDQLMAFCARAGHVHAQQVPERAMIGERAGPGHDDPWLVPFEDCLHKVRLIQVATDGAHAQVDVHALQWRGQPLIALAPVVYTMGLGRPARTRGRVSSVLAIHNPTAYLPHADAERRPVRRFAQALGADLTELRRDRGTRTAILAAMGRVSVLHYAGHGVHAGYDGERSGLLLADGLFSATDILTMERVPPLVVLSACDGSRTDSQGVAGGLGPAQAFVLAGSQDVIAAPRAVHDHAARRLFELFYDALSGPAVTVPAALQQVQLVTARSQSQEDWAAFRVIQP